MRPRDPSINITYGIITMIYLSVVIIINTLNIRVYEQDVLIPLLVPEVKPKKVKPKKEETKKEETFGNVEIPSPRTIDVKKPTIETTNIRTTKINKEALTIIESIMMCVTLPLAFGYIIGFDCSCPPDDNHVGKIIFCLGIFIPMIYIIVSDIIMLLFPDIPDILNPFLPPGSSMKDSKLHFFNQQYRKTACWSIVTLTFIIHFFSVAFGQQSSSSSAGII